MRKKMSMVSGAVMAVLFFLAGNGPVAAGDLPDVRKAGVLRHLGVPYANFVTGAGDGLDVELAQRFAAHLGVRYEYVATDWAHVITDLTGKVAAVKGGNLVVTGTGPVRGDLVANGFTVLEWREQIVDFSRPTFPTQVWLIAGAASPLAPITPGADIRADIDQVKTLMAGRTVMGKANTCLDPKLYDITAAQATPVLFDGTLNDLAPAVIQGEAETTLLDVPDALIALEKWPGQVKVIGPVSPPQEMAVAFAKTSPRLREAFDAFMEQCLRDGSYQNMVKRYYPAVFRYYPEFFQLGS